MTSLCNGFTANGRSFCNLARVRHAAICRTEHLKEHLSSFASKQAVLVVERGDQR